MQSFMVFLQFSEMLPMCNPVADWNVKGEVLLLTVESLVVEVDIPDLGLGR